MRKINGKLEPFEFIQEAVEEIVEQEPTIQDELAELKEKFAKFEELLEPLKKFLGGK